MTQTLPPLSLVDGCLFIDNSGWMESLQTCPRLLEYKQLHKRISAEESAALNFGSALHLALEFRYRNYGSGPIDVFYYDSIAPILTDFFNEHPPQADDHRNLNWAMEVIRKYNDRYLAENFSLLEYDNPLPCPQCEGKGHTHTEPATVIPCPWCQATGKQSRMVEMPFVLPLFNYHTSRPDIFGIIGNEIPVFYTGKIDLPLIRDNELFVLDHKSSSMLGQNFFAGKKMSAQLKGYCWSFQEITKRKVNGFAVNALRSNAPPAWVTNGEQESNRKGKDGVKKSLRVWWEETLQREFYRVSQDELIEWKENTIHIIKEFFWNYSQGYLPMKTEHCVRYGKCQYYDVCSLQPKEERAAFLYTGLYKDNTWSPLKQPSQPKQ